MNMLEAGKNYELTVDRMGGALAGSLSLGAGGKIQITDVVASSAGIANAFDFKIDDKLYKVHGTADGGYAFGMTPDDENNRHADDHGGTATDSVKWFYDTGQTPNLQIAFNAASGNDANHGAYYVTIAEVAGAAAASGDPFVTPMFQ